MTPAPCPTLHTNRRNIACLATPRMRTTLAGALLTSLVGPTVLADAIVTYTQNFDTLPTSSTSVGNTGAINLQAPITQISATNATWQATRISGTNTTAVPFNVGTGSGNTGGLYSYATSGSSDRSLGLFASGTTVPAAGLALVNTGTAIVNSVNTLTFTERAALQAWMNQPANTEFVANEADTQAAANAQLDLGFDITPGNIGSMRKILGIEKVKPLKPAPVHDIDLVALHAQVQQHHLQLGPISGLNLAEALIKLRDTLHKIETAVLQLRVPLEALDQRVKSLEATDD